MIWKDLVDAASPNPSGFVGSRVAGLGIHTDAATGLPNVTGYLIDLP